MKATELRIGNYLATDKSLGGYDYCELIEISKEKYKTTEGDNHITSIHYFSNPVKFLPITEEWLLKFGFAIDENGDTAWKSTTELPNHNSYYQDGQFVICKSFDEEMDGEKTIFTDYWELTIGDYRVCLYSKLYYVHQLQNAFALTGEELIYTP